MSGEPEIKPKPKRVPLGFSPAGKPMLVNQVKLAKDDDDNG